MSENKSSSGASMAKTSSLFLFSLLLSCCVRVSDASVKDRPRGVAVQTAPFYKPDGDNMFTCIDGSKKIPFDQVNDDYCDCEDASDEPGTSACSNGKFVCGNKGFVPVTILSSRVNDHVCDCCDGSDEYNSGRRCANTCDKERLKQMEKFKKANEGYQVRLKHIQEAKKDLEEKQKKLTELNTKVEIEKSKLESLKKDKETAEAPEKEAKDKHDAMIKDLKAQRDLVKTTEKSNTAFKEIDTNGDGAVTLEELLSCASIDGSNQCGVSEDEVKGWYPVDKQSLSAEEFKSDIWDSKLDSLFVTKEEKLAKEAEPGKIEEDTPSDQYNEDDDESDEYVDEDSDLDSDDGSGEEYTDEDVETTPPPPPRSHRKASRRNKDDKKKDEEDDKDLPGMDDATLKLIDVANAARDKFRDQEKVTKDAEKEKDDVEKDVNLDTGASKEFYHLIGQCFETQLKEYTYKFCPFDKGSQKPRNGGGEVNLGRWGEWSGTENGNKYSQMKLTKGQRCWNGPDRSLTVNFECGEENKILSTAEPSMCEYVMQFSTPALCSQHFDLETSAEAGIHSEL